MEIEGINCKIKGLRPSSLGSAPAKPCWSDRQAQIQLASQSVAVAECQCLLAL